MKQRQITLMDTRGNFYLGIRLPTKDYKPKNEKNGRLQQYREYINRPEVKERRAQYRKEYYKRPEVIARRKTPEARADKAAYDKLYSKRPGYKERKKELLNKREKNSHKGA